MSAGGKKPAGGDSPLRVAFVACNKNPRKFWFDPSFRYRCENIGLALRECGHRAEFLHLKKFPLPAGFDAVVLHRPSDGLRFRLVRWICARRGIPLMADVDDLIFDPMLAEFSPGVMNRLVPMPLTRRRFASHRRALGLASSLTCTTGPLASRLRQAFPRAHITTIPNTVHRTWIDKPSEPVPPEAQDLIYTPGTRSHDRDFGVIAGTIERLLKENPALGLRITGALDWRHGLAPGRVHLAPKVPFEQFHKVVRGGWINLAPLEESPFNRCKSALKVIEAAFWNIPTLCSPLPDAERFRGCGAIICTTPGEWAQNISNFLLNPAALRQQSQGLRERMLADTRDVASRWLEAAVRAA